MGGTISFRAAVELTDDGDGDRGPIWEGRIRATPVVHWDEVVSCLEFKPW